MDNSKKLCVNLYEIWELSRSWTREELFKLWTWSEQILDVLSTVLLKGTGKKGNGKKGNGKKGNRKKGNLSLLTRSHTDQCLEPDMNNNARSLHHNSYGKSKNIIQRADKRTVRSPWIKYCNGQPMNRIVSPTARKKLSIDLCPAT